jgi:hypothetical protein
MRHIGAAAGAFPDPEDHGMLSAMRAGSGVTAPRKFSDGAAGSLFPVLQELVKGHISPISMNLAPLISLKFLITPRGFLFLSAQFFPLTIVSSL